MKIVKEIPFPTELPFVNQNNRIENFISDLKRALDVKARKIYAVPYVSIDDNGVIQKSKLIIERRDCLTLQWMSVCNVFCDPDKTIQIDTWTGITLDAREIQWIYLVANKEIEKLDSYFGKHLEFFQKKIPESLIGLTIEQALVKLKELGYY